MEQHKADAAAELDKLKAASKQLQDELSNARKEASVQADSAKGVEKQLAEATEEMAGVKAQLQALQVGARRRPALDPLILSSQCERLNPKS